MDVFYINGTRRPDREERCLMPNRAEAVDGPIVEDARSRRQPGLERNSARSSAAPRSPRFGFAAPALVLREPGLHQLAHQSGRQGFVRLKADGPLAGVIALEFVLV